jgi:hypothetical protein
MQASAEKIIAGFNSVNLKANENLWINVFGGLINRE